MRAFLFCFFLLQKVEHSLDYSRRSGTRSNFIISLGRNIAFKKMYLLSSTLRLIEKIIFTIIKTSLLARPSFFGKNKMIMKKLLAAGRTAISFKTPLLILVLLLANACSRNPVTGKKQLLFMSEQQELAMGKNSKIHYCKRIGNGCHFAPTQITL